MRGLLPGVRSRGLDVLVVALAVIGLVRVWSEPGSGRVGAAGCALVATLPLLARRRFPLAAPMVALAGDLMLTLLVRGAVAEQLQFYLGALVCFWVIGSENDSPGAELGLAAGIGVALAAVGTDPVHHGAGDFVFAVVMTSASWVGGRRLGVRARQAADAERRADQLQAEREAHAREVVAAERARIARDLHDVIAHTVSVMVVQAGAAEQVLGDGHDDVRQALEAIRASGKSALVELRRLVGLLRPEEAEDRAPQPSLGQLDHLITAAHAGGLRVRTERAGDPRPLPPGVDQAAYRILQEAITNAIKHAGPADVTVSIQWEPDALLLAVHDNGHPATRQTDGGHGLVGMRERARLFGGELHAGPSPDGGFGVTARLPA